jgi:hypothetical protein
MDTIVTAGSALGYIDLALIGAVYYKLNKRIDSISPSDSLNIGAKAASSSSSGIFGGSTGVGSSVKLQDRILRLETDNEVLLQRMQCYDKLFEQILCFIKENKSHMEIPVQIERHLQQAQPERQPDCSPSRKTSLKARRVDSILTRKECFVDDEVADVAEDASEVVVEASKDDSDEDDMFSFLQ